MDGWTRVGKELIRTRVGQGQEMDKSYRVVNN